MLAVGLVLLFLLTCFSFVLLFGAPYLPTLTKHVAIAMEVVDLKPGETLLELGCGDGKVLIAAAERGWKVVGYELNPLLALLSWLRTRRYGKRVTVKWGNFWTQDWPPAQGIFVFVMPRHMAKLDKKIIQSTNQSVKLVSFAFEVPNKKPLIKKDGVYLYQYN